MKVALREGTIATAAVGISRDEEEPEQVRRALLSMGKEPEGVKRERGRGRE